MHIGREAGSRDLSVRDFCKGEDGARLQHGEILLAISIPFSKTPTGFKFFKHARRKTADLAIANMAVAYEEVAAGMLENVKIVIGGIGMAIEQSKQLPIIIAANTSALLSSAHL